MNLGAGEDKGPVEGDWLGDDGKGNGGVMFWSGWGVNRILETVQKTGLEVKVRDVVAGCRRGVVFVGFGDEKAGGSGSFSDSYSSSSPASHSSRLIVVLLSCG